MEEVERIEREMQQIFNELGLKMSLKDLFKFCTRGAGYGFHSDP